MSAKSTKGLSIWLSKGSATPTELTPTAATKAQPCVVSCTTTGVKDGDIVFVNGTGLASIDGKAWVVANQGATSIDLLGSDTSNDPGTFSAGGATVKHYATGDMVRLCLSSITVNVDDPSTVQVGTFCDPTASLPSQVQSAGTVSVAGFVDTTSADYQELLVAADDSLQRYIRINLPNNGYLVAPVTFSSISWDIPLDGAVAFSGTGVLGSKFAHQF